MYLCIYVFMYLFIYLFILEKLYKLWALVPLLYKTGGASPRYEMYSDSTGGTHLWFQWWYCTVAAPNGNRLNYSQQLGRSIYISQTKRSTGLYYKVNDVLRRLVALSISIALPK